MGRLKEKSVGKEDIFVGIDLHKQRWHVATKSRKQKRQGHADPAFSLQLPAFRLLYPELSA
jgi:hypothetical protein